MDLLLDELRQGLKVDDLQTIADIWKLWVKAFCKGMFYDYDSLKTVIMKSPDYGKSALSGFKHIKNTKVIFLIRNPFYAIDSLKRSREMRGLKLHVFELINVFRDYNLLLHTIQNIKKDEKRRQDSCIIKYEDFLQNPQKTMRSVADFISIPFSEEFMRPTMNGKPWYGLSSFDVLNGISKKPLSRKIKTLHDWEIETIKSHLMPFFRYFNYSLTVHEGENEQKN
jgi:hypothetical protein